MTKKKRQIEFCLVFKQPAMTTGNGPFNIFYIDSSEQPFIGLNFICPSLQLSLQINALTNEKEKKYSFVDEHILIFRFQIYK